MNERVTKTAKHTLTLLTTVYEALKHSAERDGVEPNELIQSLIIDRVIADGTLDADTQEHILIGRRLIASAVEVAKRRCRDGQFSETITLDTFKECSADKEWLKDYEAYVGDNPYKNGNPLKGINREIGFAIRRAIGGVVQKDGAGKPVTTKVLGEVIQSFTPMADYDRAAI